MENFRKYGDAPYNIALVHGGPGAPGELASVARELSSNHGVIEPLQTASSIEDQVYELLETVKDNADPPVIMAGWSWGAWLSYIFTAEHPELVRKLILIESGPFNKESAAEIMTTRLERLDEDDKFETLAVMKALNEPDTENRDLFLARLGELIAKADSYNAASQENEVLEYRYDIYEQVWEEAKDLRDSGILLGLGLKIQCPVIAIHGDFDPHPYQGVRDPLSDVISNFKFVLIENCGHYPWLEKEARDSFYQALKQELS